MIKDPAQGDAGVYGEGADDAADARDVEKDAHVAREDEDEEDAYEA